MRKYTWDGNAAKKGDSSRIDESGAYTGKFTRAMFIKSEKGAEGIQFSFQRDDGAECNYLSVYTHGKEGQEIMGYARVQALMTCMKTKTLDPVEGMIEEKNFETGEVTKKKAILYPDLVNKRVGVFLQKEEYINKKGEIKDSFKIVSCFDADTRQTASEYLDKKEATVIDKMIHSLMDKKVKTGSSGKSNQEQLFDALKEYDDECPF